MLTYAEFLNRNTITESVLTEAGKFSLVAPEKSGVSIGDRVMFKKPVNGVSWGIVTGFGIKAKDVKNAAAPGAKLAGSKVSTYMVRPKQSPGNGAADWVGGPIEIARDKFLNITDRANERAAMAFARG